MRLVVTGGLGFIGSQFVRLALAGELPGIEPDEIIVLDKMTYAGHRANLASVEGDRRLRLVIGDICDAATVKRELARVDLVVHFAAESHVDRSIESSQVFFETNVVGTGVLLKCALDAQVGRFVHVSTDEVYGSIETGLSSEDAPLLPNSPYAAAKAASDLVARSFHRTYGLPVSVTRCSNNYGPYQHPEKLLPRFITNLLDGLTVPLYGDGLNRRSWLHVDDHCRGIALVAMTGQIGEIYNIGGDFEATNYDLTRELLDLTGRDESAIRMVPDRLGHDRRYALDTTKIEEALGFQARIGMGRGLRETLEWYRRRRDWWEPLKRG